MRELTPERYARPVNARSRSNVKFAGRSLEHVQEEYCQEVSWPCGQHPQPKPDSHRRRYSATRRGAKAILVATAGPVLYVNGRRQPARGSSLIMPVGSAVRQIDSPRTGSLARSERREPCRRPRSQARRRNLRCFRGASAWAAASPCFLRKARDRFSDSAARSRTFLARRAISL